MQRRSACTDDGDDSSSALLPHPLDWASYLRRSVVLNSVPTAITLLVLAAHCHACCPLPAGGAASDPASPSSSAGDPFSVLGTLFSGASWLWSAVFQQEDARSANNDTTRQRAYAQPLSLCVPTPWEPAAATRLQAGSRQARHARVPGESGDNDTASGDPHDESDDDSEDPSDYSHDTPPGEEQAASFADSILRASLKDPFTIAYSMWEMIAGAQEGPQADAQPHKISVVAEDVVKKPTTRSCDWTMKQQRNQRKQEARSRRRAATEDRARSEQSRAEAAAAKHSAVWMDVCVMHAVGLLGVSFALLPSILVGGRHLVCNAAVPLLQASAWPLLNCGALLFSLSWVACSAIHNALGLPDLALCTAMHMVALLVAGFADVAMGCPLPPIYMPGTAAVGMGFALGLLLMCISQMHAASAGAAASFYMNHVWASCVCVFCARHTVLRAATSAACYLQREIIARGVEGAAAKGVK